MKVTALTLLFSFSLLLGFSQQPVTYDEVIVMPDISQADLFDRAENWLLHVYKSPGKHVQSKDEEDGWIVATGTMNFVQTKGDGPNTTRGNIHYSIKLYAKDGKYRYVFTDFIHSAHYDFGLITDAKECGCKFPFSFRDWRRRVWNDMKAQMEAHVKTLSASLVETMNRELKPEEW